MGAYQERSHTSEHAIQKPEPSSPFQFDDRKLVKLPFKHLQLNSNDCIPEELPPLIVAKGNAATSLGDSLVDGERQLQCLVFFLGLTLYKYTGLGIPSPVSTSGWTSQPVIAC